MAGDRSIRQSVVPLGQEIKTTLAWNTQRGSTCEQATSSRSLLLAD
jgi:hypothetical protein